MVKRESPHANTAYGAPPNKMPGFPAQIAGTPTNRGEARRYEVRRGHDPFGYAQDRLYRAPTGESDSLLELLLKIKMVVVPASGIERGRADRAARLALQVFGNRQLCAACSTQNGFLIPFAARPNLDGMTCERDMAVFAGIVGGAALHFDGDDVRVRMVVQATGLGIEIQSTDLWSICRCGAAGD